MPTRRWGSEKIVNTTTAGNQVDSRVVALANGRFVATWRETHSNAVRAQIFDAFGTPVGSELLLLPPGGSAPLDYDVAGLADGGFYLTWTQADGSFPLNLILGKVYAADGAFLRDQPVLFGFGQDRDVTVERFGAGAVVAWKGYTGTSDFRIFDGSGTGGSILSVYATGGGNHANGGQVAIATSPLQNIFLAAWLSASDHAIRLQTFHASGAALSVPTDVTPGAFFRYRAPAVAWINSEDVVLAWEDESDGSFRPSIKFRIFKGADDGNPVGATTSAITANSNISGYRRDPEVVALASGGFVIAWRDEREDVQGNEVDSIRLQAFDSSGGKIGGEAIVNGTSIDSGGIATFSLAALPDGRVTVSWTGIGDSATDGDGSAIRLQIIDPRDGIVIGTAAAETLYGHDFVNDEISGYAGHDTLFGMRGDDMLWGGAGHDTLDGGRGADDLHGGTGNDTYIVGAGDTVVEVVGGGIDTVQSATLSLNLASYAGIENIILTGALALKATGNSGANVIDGAQNSAANVLTGLGGNDIFIVGPGDTIVEVAGGGTDTVQSALISLALASYPGVQNLTLTGTLPLAAIGDTTANVLDGAQNSAANVLTGLAGNDLYILGAGDTVVEQAGGGSDTVRSALGVIILANHPNVENAALLGSEPSSIIGTSGNNILDGSMSNASNTLVGGFGNDTYIVGPGDTIMDAAGAVGDIDTVQSGLISVHLPTYADTENATLTGGLALDATGTSGANVLTGNAGANVLSGLGGGDTFIGLGGMDTLVGGNGADRFRFLAAADSAVGANRDVIQGFNAAGGDRIDLAAIDANAVLAGDQGFAFLGTAAFGGAAGQLRFLPSGADVIVQGTIGGAAVAFEIRVAGVASLSAADFTL